MADVDVANFLNDMNNDSGTMPPSETPKVDEDGAIEVETIEVSGVIKDSQGHVWRVPDGNVDDLGDLGKTHVLGNLKKDPAFEYVMINVNDIDEYVTNQWVLVTRSEVALPDAIIQKEGYGSALAGYVHLMDSVMVKKPKVLVKRDRAILDQPGKDAMADLDPSEEMRIAMRDAGIPMKNAHRRTEETVDQRELEDIESMMREDT